MAGIGAWDWGVKMGLWFYKKLLSGGEVEMKKHWGQGLVYQASKLQVNCE